METFWIQQTATTITKTDQNGATVEPARCKIKKFKKNRKTEKKNENVIYLN